MVGVIQNLQKKTLDFKLKIDYISIRDYGKYKKNKT